MADYKSVTHIRKIINVKIFEKKWVEVGENGIVGLYLKYKPIESVPFYRRISEYNR